MLNEEFGFPNFEFDILVLGLSSKFRVRKCLGYGESARRKLQPTLRRSRISLSKSRHFRAGSRL